MTAKNVAGPSREQDRYYTPRLLARRIVSAVGEELENLRTSGSFKVNWRLDRLSILEPGAGDGAFVAESLLRWPTAKVCAVELDAEIDPIPDARGAMWVKGQDFLSWKEPLGGAEPYKFDLSIGNPPYSHAEAFARHAISMSHNVALLVRLGFLSSKGRRALFAEHQPAAVFVLPDRPSFTGKGTDSADYCVILWSDVYSLETRLTWIAHAPR